MGRASIWGESSTRDNMVNSLLFSSLLLVGAGQLAVGQWWDDEPDKRSALGEDRFTNDGTHVRTVWRKEGKCHPEAKTTHLHIFPPCSVSEPEMLRPWPVPGILRGL